MMRTACTRLDHDAPATRSPLPERRNALPSRFASIARTYPDKAFIVLHEEGRQRTFGDAFARAELFAGAFAARGVRPGQIVAIVLGTHLDQGAAFFGAMLLGAIPAFFPPLSPKQDAAIFWSQHAELFQRIELAAIVSDAFNIGLIGEHLPEFAPRCFDVDLVEQEQKGHFTPYEAEGDEIAFLQHSSGTTGLKKGVALTHAMVLTHIDSFAQCLAIDKNDKIASWLPLYHDMGLIACFVAPALLGLTSVMLDPFSWVRRPALLLEAIAAHRATLCWQPNFAFQHLVRLADPAARYDLGSVRAMIDCSEPCKPATLDAFRARFLGDGLKETAPQVSYAMAEAVFLVTQTPLDRKPRTLVVDAESLDRDGVVRETDAESGGREFLSCGPATRGVRIRILDDHGNILPERRVGEIGIASDSLFQGYYRLEAAPGRLENGWYRTNDRGFLDNGELFVTGRTDDLLIVNGKNIYAHDVEFCVNAHCDVKAGRVVAIAPFNPRVGSRSLVVIAETDKTDKEFCTSLGQAIKSAINAAFAATVYEAMIVAPGWIAKTTSGKISRAENLARYVAMRPGFQEG